MRSFLEEVVDQLEARFPGQLIENVKVIFPTRRAGLFFQQALAKKLDQPIWAPATLTLEEWGQSLSSLQSADNLFLIFKLYQVYKSLAPTEESFDKFFFWGEMLLEDFEQVDQHLLDARLLFANLEQLKELDQPQDYLQPEQLEVIRGFWQSFSAQGSPQQQDFVALWQVLHQVYQKFQEELLAEGIGYNGMLFRQLAEACKNNSLNPEGGRLVFAGFNELSPAEDTLIQYFIKEHGALSLWDTDAYYLKSGAQEAGLFLRKWAQHPTYSPHFPESIPDRLNSHPPSISITGVPLEVGQTKALGEQLLECLARQKSVDLEKTAIVLPDEHLLFPLLHALPASYTDSNQNEHPISTLNVTMGYPLRSTSLYSLIELLVNLQENKSEDKQGHQLKFHHRSVLASLRHPYIYYYDQKLAIETIEEIEQENYIYLDVDYLAKRHPLYSKIFKQVAGIQQLFDYLLNILEEINESLNETNYEQPAIEQEYIFQFFTHLKRLRELVNQQRLELRLSVFLKLLRQIMQSQRLPFSGEPLGGLQIMGVLETRALDFDNLFILSMNEGSFPPAPKQASFIPYNLRRGYGLPTYEHTDAAYAYYFYRMIQRAKHVHLFYNTASANGLKGEPSRLIYQLLYESGFSIKQQVLAHKLNLQQRHTLSITKSAEVMDRLKQYLQGYGEGGRQLTPSALNIYLDCPLKFYFKYVALLQEAEEVQEEIDAAIFGNMVHHSLEEVYTRLIRHKGNTRVESQDFDFLARQLPEAVDYAYRQHYNLSKNAPPPQGRNYLVYTILKKLSRAVIKCDETYAPFSIVALESKAILGPQRYYGLDVPVLVAGEYRKLALKGIIDRIDEKDGCVRVLDYKTGRDESSFTTVASLFDPENKNRNKAAMQTIFYGLLYKNAHPGTTEQIVPGLYNSRELFGSGFSPQLTYGEARNKKQLDDVREVEDEFMGELANLLQEIMDPSLPFGQTTEEQRCSYCSFRGICHR